MFIVILCFISFLPVLKLLEMILLSSSGHGTIGSGVALAVVASIAVDLRLVAKRATKGGFATDDYWIIFAATTFWVYVGVEFLG